MKIDLLGILTLSLLAAMHRRGGGSRCWCSVSLPRSSGGLYALMEHNIQRLLAYHTLENIGIILLGWALA